MKGPVMLLPFVPISAAASTLPEVERPEFTVSREVVASLHIIPLLRSIWVKGIILGAMAALLMACTPGSTAGSAEGGEEGPPRLDGFSSQYTQVVPVRTARLTPFQAANGETIDLSRFRGKVVLLNFWATWCPPCIYEMPSLDRLAAEMSGDKFAIVPISIDDKGLPTVAPFYRKHGLDNLDIYLDPDQRTAYLFTDNLNNAEFALYGLPISYVVDHEGRVMGYIAGAADWDSDAAKALIRYYIERIGR